LCILQTFGTINRNVTSYLFGPTCMYFVSLVDLFLDWVGGSRATVHQLML